MIDAYTKTMAWLGEQHTKQELSELLGLSLPTLQSRLDDLRHGNINAWRFAEVCSLADFLGCTVNDLR